MTEAMEMSPLERAELAAREELKHLLDAEGPPIERRIARAVLLAFREPSEGMLEGFGIHKSRMRQNWQDMVDAALAE